jgi:hypothetical protein
MSLPTPNSATSSALTSRSGSRQNASSVMARRASTDCRLVSARARVARFDARTAMVTSTACKRGVEGR